MANPPKVCIGLPVFNGDAFLAQAVDSILGQSFGDFELVISDNASTDGTADIAARYAARDRRVRVVRNDANIGANPNFNRVFAQCRSPYFKWAVYDDLLGPHFLAACVELLEQDPGAVLAHTAVTVVGADGHRLPQRADGRIVLPDGRPSLAVEPLHLAERGEPERRFAEVLRRMTWNTAAMGLIRADCLRRTRLFGAHYGADHTLLAELALLGRFRQADEPAYIKRVHGTISVHLSSRDRELWSDPRQWLAVPGLKLRLSYLTALGVARLTPRQYLSGLVTVARVAARNEMLYRLLPHGLRSLPLLGRMFSHGA